MANPNKVRETTRSKVREKRAAVRRRLRKGHSSVAVARAVKVCYGACRGVSSDGAVILVVAVFLFAAGCNLATPASKSAGTRACDNVTTVNNHFGLIVIPTNGGAPSVVGLAGPVTVNVSDVNGTIAQSADTEGGDRTDLTAVPTMSAGIIGDKPIEAVQKAVSAFASPQDALGATLSAMAEKYGWSSTTNALGSAAASCTGGACGTH